MYLVWIVGQVLLAVKRVVLDTAADIVADIVDTAGIDTGIVDPDDIGDTG